MKFNRTVLFDGLRREFGKLDGVQQSVVAAVVDEFERRDLSNVRWLSYMLATAWGECKWKPVREIGRGKGKKYGKPVNGKAYYGRGLVQLTWLQNYEKMGALLNLPLVSDPDLALTVPAAVAIMFEGMIGGHFTGKKLDDCFNENSNDPMRARAIINGKDKALQFLKWHLRILDVLHNAVIVEDEYNPVSPKEPATNTVETAPRDRTRVGGAGGAVVAGGGAAAAAASQGWHWTYIIAALVVVGGSVYIINKRKSP